VRYLYVFFVYHILSCSFGSNFYHCIYGCMFCVLLFNFVNYVFLLLCTLCSVYSVFIVPTGTLRLSWLRFFRAFSSVVRQMPGGIDGARPALFPFKLFILLFFLLIVLFYVLSVCQCVLYCCHRVSTQLQLTTISVLISLKNYKKLYTVLSCLGVFSFCTCCILICLVCIVASFKLSFV